MAPRPITLVVAQELSDVPQAVIDEHRKAQTPTKPATSPNFRPSPANGDESVGQVSESIQPNVIDAICVLSDSLLFSSGPPDGVTTPTVRTDLDVPSEIEEHVDETVAVEGVADSVVASNVEEAIGAVGLRTELEESQPSEGEDTHLLPVTNALGDDISDVDIDDFLPPEEPNIPNDVIDSSAADIAVDVTVEPNNDHADLDERNSKDVEKKAPTEEKGGGEDTCGENNMVQDDNAVTLEMSNEKSERESDRLEEIQPLGGEICFDGCPPVYNGWDNLVSRPSYTQRPIFSSADVCDINRGGCPIQGLEN